MSSSSKLSFSFGGAKPAAGSSTLAPKSNMEALMAKTKAKPAKPALFDEDEDDSAPGAAPPSLTGPSRSRPSPSQPPSTRPGDPVKTLPRTARKAQEQALALDSTAFEYDEVYDQLKARERAAEIAKKAEAEDRKPKYIENFLASAQTRKLDRLRAEEKMLALEREKEGGEFEDKEKFVTEGYKKQMEEVRKAEEEERQREEALRKSTKGPGLTAFYKNMLDTSAAARDVAIDTAQANGNAGPSLAVRPPTAQSYEPEAEYDPFLAKEEAAAQGASSSAPKTGSRKVMGPDGVEVEMNDEGEVVDKRELLRAGLNITKKPKPELPNSLLSGGRSGIAQEGPYQSKAVGTAAGYQDRMRRERERLAQALKEENERKRVEAERRAAEEEEAARKRREGDDGEAERRRKEARERFLARKRDRDEGTGGKDAADADSKKVKL